MNDRELLELAAKAAGIKARWFRVKQWGKRRDYPGTRFYAGIKQVFGTHHAKPWDPLTDDGDALRLAERLEMTICMDGSASCSAQYWFGNERLIVTEWLKSKHDRLKGVRRAIVRAAAEIGRSLP